MVAYPVAAGVRIFAGGMVSLNAAGYAVPASDTAGQRFVGVARAQIDNTGGADGAKMVEVYEDGVFQFAANGLAATDVGRPLFAVDDQTVQLATTHSVAVGVLDQFVSATSAWVAIHPALRRSAAAQADVSASDGAPAAGANPTKAEFDAVVALANETKAVVNALLAKLRAAQIVAS